MALQSDEQATVLCHEHINSHPQLVPRQHSQRKQTQGGKHQQVIANDITGRRVNIPSATGSPKRARYIVTAAQLLDLYIKVLRNTFSVLIKFHLNLTSLKKRFLHILF